MSNKHRSPVPGNLIQMTDKGMEQYLGEKLAKIQAHLNEAGNARGIHDSAMNSVVLAAIQHGGLEVAEAPDFVGRCAAVAKQIADRQLRLKWEGIRDALSDLKVERAQPHMEWAAKRAGVDLDWQSAPTAQ